MAYKTFVNGFPLNASEINNNLMNQSIATFPNVAARTEAIDSPAEGQVVYIENIAQFQWWTGANWAQFIPDVATSPNYIINGAFDFNQRGFTSSTITAAYGFDRFQFRYTGGTTTYSAQSFTPGAAPVAGYESVSFARLSSTGQSATNDFAYFLQRIEDVRTLAGQTATISFWAKASSGAPNVGVSLEQSFGAGGSSLVVASAGVQAINTSWGRYSFTVAVPSLTGKTIGTGSLLAVGLMTSAGSGISAAGYPPVGIQNDTIDIWGVQVEAGSVATPFRRNANSIQGELAACQRYYYRATATTITTAYGLGVNSGTVNAVIFLKTPVTMRVSPTSVGFAGLMLTDGANNYGVSAVAIGDAHPDLTNLNVTSSGLTQFRPSYLRANATLTSFVELNAEL